MNSGHSLLFVLAAAAYAVNALFGASVRLRWIDSGSFRWVHHALYAITVILTLTAISTLAWSGSIAGWYLLPAVVPLAALPYVGSARRHTGRHIAVALVPLPFYIVSVLVSLTGASAR